MNDFETEERSVKQAEFAHSQALSPKGFLLETLEGTPIDRIGDKTALNLLAAQPRHVGEVRETAPLETHPPYVLEVEVNCDECGGSGSDPGGMDPWALEPCPVCHGAKTQSITRNYLAEAFQIAANHESTRPVERQHLVAVIQHCRHAVSLMVSLPDVI